MTRRLDRAERCSACGTGIDLHFSKPHGRGDWLGCTFATLFLRWLEGHGLTTPDLPPAAREPRPPRRSDPALQATVRGGGR